MDRLTGEARDRVRALSLWLVAVLVLTGVGVTAYATVVGFVSVSPTTIDGVVVTDGGAPEIVVHYRAGSPGCDELDRIEVTESDAEIVLRAYNRTRRPLQGRACLAIDEGGQVAVVLDEPVGERVVRDRDQRVPVVSSRHELPGLSGG